MTRPAGGKPHYRLQVSNEIDFSLLWRTVKFAYRGSNIREEWCRWVFSSAEAIRRAPR